MQTVADLDNLTDAQLLDALGSELYGDQKLGVGTDDAGRKRRLARQWISDRTDELRSQICRDGALLRVVQSDQADRIAEAAIVADAIAGALGRPTANIVAVILVRRGIATLCG